MNESGQRFSQPGSRGASDGAKGKGKGKQAQARHTPDASGSTAGAGSRTSSSTSSASSARWSLTAALCPGARAQRSPQGPCFMYVPVMYMVARARGGVRYTSGFTGMSPSGACGGGSEAQGVPHLGQQKPQ